MTIEIAIGFGTTSRRKKHKKYHFWNEQLSPGKSDEISREINAKLWKWQIQSPNARQILPISTKRAIWNCSWTSTVFLRGFEWSLSENENHTLIYTYTGGLTRIFKKIGDLEDIFWGRYFSCTRSQGVAALVSQSGTIVRRAGLSRLVLGPWGRWVGQRGFDRFAFNTKEPYLKQKEKKQKRKSS